MDALALIPWGTVTPGMLLALVVVFLIRGDLRTHREVREILQSTAREIKTLVEERDHWREVSMTLLQATIDNTESAKVVARMLAAVEEKAKVTTE